MDGVLNEVGCLAHLASPQLFDDRLCFVVGRLTTLLGMNGLEHVAHRANLGRRHVAENVAIEMHHAALVARLGQKIRDAFDKTSAGVGNDQLHTFKFKAAVDQMAQKR